jgi:hypothetical protein
MMRRIDALPLRAIQDDEGVIVTDWYGCDLLGLLLLPDPGYQINAVSGYLRGHGHFYLLTEALP